MFDESATWILIKLLEVSGIMGLVFALIMLVFVIYTASSFFIETIKNDLKERKKRK